MLQCTVMYVSDWLRMCLCVCYREWEWGWGGSERERERDHSSNIDNLLLDPTLNMHKLVSHVQQFLFAHTCPFERLTSVARHFLSSQHCFLRPSPPNFGISLHDEHCPQFS